MATGENSGTWGNVTNVNLGTALEEAIVGSSDVTFASANVTLTLTDSNASQTARNLRLNLTGTTGGARDLIVPAIEKVYIVNNGCADTITIKNSSGTGISVPAGKTEFVYNNGTNVVEAINHLTSLTIDTPLPVTSGGTGSNTGINVQTSVTGVLPVANGGTGSSSAAFSGANITALNATELTSGTVPDARFPATLPAVSGANLTSLNATALASGTVPDARFPATLPAVSGVNLTNLNASSITSGTVPTARLGSGTASSSTFLRGDQTYATVTSLPGAQAQLFTSSGTFTIPTGISAIKTTVIGGGAGGHRGYNVGGGGGGIAEKWYTGLTPGNTITVTIGAGGATQNTGNNNGVNGGTTSISSGSQSITGISATGGFSSGQSFPFNVSPGNVGFGGSGSGGDINGSGGACVNSAVGAAAAGGDTVPNIGQSGVGPYVGGSSPWGYGGRGYLNPCNSNWSTVVAPFGYGTGGACMNTNYNGLSGAVLIEW